MNKINQALFGYSNGHRLLASSIKLSTNSKRLMERLSDLSGNEISQNSDGYYTGCWLSEENCYAICKTWYATEMPRPGCAWTHAIFLDSKTYSTDVNIAIDSLFQRPAINMHDFLSYYKVPLEAEDKDLSMCEHPSKDVEWLFNSIITQKENIALCNDNTIKINHTFECLFQLMGVDFFKNFTFCTASQSNRMIKEKPLTFQVFSTKVSKVALRSLTSINYPEHQSENPFSTNIDSTDYMMKIKRFALNWKKQCYSFEYFETIKKIYGILYSHDGVKLSSFINAIRDSFTIEQSLSDFPLFLDIFINDALSDNRLTSSLTNLLINLSVLEGEYENFSNTLNVCIYEKYARELYLKASSSILEIISRLLCSELNLFGEKFVKALAFVIDSNAFMQMFSKGEHHYTVLLQWNWHLGENALLWKHPVAIQFEMIRNIAIAFNKASNLDKDDFSKILFLIFEDCSTDIANEVYAAFGDFSISAYFIWANKSNWLSKDSWLCICKNNSYKSLIVFNSIENATTELFCTLLKTLNPWDSTMRSIKAQTLEQLYQKYCCVQGNSQLNDLFAKFALQVMINADIRVSEEMAKFVFIRVHRILGEPDFDSNFWNAISPHLPEIKWYNSWDKCKRLRKFAKKEGYYNIFV